MIIYQTARKATFTAIYPYLLWPVADQVAKPHGPVGRFVGMMMNAWNAPLHEWGIKHIDQSDHWCQSIVDVGCGAGDGLKKLARAFPDAHIWGFDPSLIQVNAANSCVRKYVRSGQIDVCFGEADHLSLGTSSVDWVTAFEVSYYWKDEQAALQEILRVLKPGGGLLICNSTYTHPLYRTLNRRFPRPAHLPWHVYSVAEYQELLRSAGFKTVQTDEVPERNWIAVTGQKGYEPIEVARIQLDGSEPDWLRIECGDKLERCRHVVGFHEQAA